MAHFVIYLYILTLNSAPVNMRRTQTRARGTFIVDIANPMLYNDRMLESTIYKKIIDFLMEIIERNYDDRDYKLPSERSLSLKFNSSRKPALNAYKALIERGYVKSVHGKGYFINEFTGDKPAPPMPKSKKVCFVTPSIQTPFMQSIIKGIKDFCEKHMLNFLVTMTDQDVKKETRFLQSVPYSDYSGVIIYPVDSEFYSENLLKLSMRHFPVVIIDRNLKGVNVAYVAMDNHKAMADAVNFLHGKKYKNIVYVTPPPSLATSAEERINGFNHGLFKYYGVAKNNNLLKIKPDDYPAIQHAVVNHLKKNPDTDVLIVTGAQATTALKAAAELNIPVPAKLRLMIIDNELSDTEKASVQPYIIYMDGYEMGRKAAAALYNQIYGDLRITLEKLPAQIIDCSARPETV